MTIRITTTRAVLSLCLALAYMALTPATPAAADREHQQIMADLRMLQEQTQQLQALMNDLGEALKAVSSRIEDQTGLERKAFADGKVQMDTMSGDLRIVREKVDETNVRLGSITQELESIRQAIPEPGAFTSAPPNPLATDQTGAAIPGTSPAGTAPPSTTVAATPPSGIQPQRLWQSSFADYTAANYSLAIQGFESYLKYFPKGQQAHEAQLYVGEALALDKKDADAVVAYVGTDGLLQARAGVRAAWRTGTRQGIVRRGHQAVPRYQRGHDGAAAARGGQQQVGEIVFSFQFSVVSFQ